MATLYVAAQDSLLLRDYQYVRQQDTWLTRSNAAALTRFAARNIVEAEASATYGSGHLVNFNESPKTLQADVNIESFYRLSHRTVCFGSISYDNWTGRDMTGSVFMSSRLPFDIVEDSLTNSGRKHRDTYRLTGGFGVDVWRGVSLGARLDYTSANYAKYKDLRHKNKLMDLQLTAGIYAPILTSLWKGSGVGLSYSYHRRTESLEFATYGKSEKVYKSLIDYGGFFGIVEQFGYDGYTDSNSEMPLFEDGHGGTFQMEVRPLAPLSVYADLSLHHGTGYYGRRSQYTITYSRHRRDVVEAAAAIAYTSASSRHRLGLSYAQEKVSNKAETFRGLTNDYGATHYEYYDAAETGNKRWRTVQADYTLCLGVRGELPTWQLAAGYHWMQRRQVSYLYPYYRWQQLSVSELSLSATRNLLTRRGVWSFNLNATYQKGTGDPSHDGTLTATADQQQPATMPDFLCREYHCLTASQYQLGAGVKYAFLFPGIRLKTHARLSVTYRRATDTGYYEEGKDHTLVSVAVGCTL
jgi:hypothetical protein